MRSSTFTEILEEAVTSLPGALGAIFVDWEGEAVDEFATPAEPEIRVTGAQWGVAYYLARDLCAKHALGVPGEVVLRFQRQQVIISRVTDEYLLVLAMDADANLGRALEQARHAAVRLREEM
jgi:predicted regulator of Ras-like GTPase activity (Roadblock/LC7/MglB family)